METKMKNYSQRSEQQYIIDYFKDSPGVFIDIGAYHPEVFSNVRALFSMGWAGVLVEPSPNCFPALQEFYSGALYAWSEILTKDVELYNYAIANHTGEIELWDSRGDALSTTSDSHKEKWERGYDCKFDKITVPCLTVSDLIGKSKYKTFDFINIDVENDQLGFDILRQFGLTNTKMVCLECEGDMRREVQTYLKDFRLIYTSPENILLCR